MKKVSLLLITLLCHSEIYPTKIPNSGLVTTGNLGNLSLHHKPDGFYVQKNNQLLKIHTHLVDAPLRTATPEQISTFLQVGYLHLKQMNNGDYTITAKTRGVGGGPLAGMVAYWLTKSVCYGTVAAAATTVTVASGGLAGAAVGAGMTGAVIGTGAAATAGASMVGGAIAGAGLASEAAVAMAGFVAGSGGVAGAVAAVETASATAGAIFTAIPFLP